MSNNGHLQVVPSVFTIIQKKDKVLLLRRANTGYMDGWYDLPAGHLEEGETFVEGAVRELKEETGLVAKPEDLRLVHLYQNHTSLPAHYGHIFVATKWSGEPKIMEPNKCDDLKFFGISKLPEKTLPYTKQAIEEMSVGEVTFSYQAPGSLKQ